MEYFDKRAVSAAVITAAVWLLAGISGIASSKGGAGHSPGELLIMAGGQLAQEVSELEAEVAEDASDPYRDRPDIDTGDWMFILANPWNDIGDYTPELAYLEGQQFDESTVINTDTGIDSMGFTLIICRLEAAFDVRIPNRQWQKLSTLGDVVDAIEKRMPQA